MTILTELQAAAARKWHGDPACQQAGLFWRAAAELKRLTAERDAFKQSLYAEMDENLRLRELGGAGPDETITAFAERLIRERDELRAELEREHADSMQTIADCELVIAAERAYWRDAMIKALVARSGQNTPQTLAMSLARMVADDRK